MHKLSAIFKRELLGYFITPVAYVFIGLLLLTSGAFTFYISNLYEAASADLASFFMWHPWIYLFFIPAITMRLWAEERKTSTLEILLTLPIPTWQLVAAKFLAAWCFTAIALFLTFPLWLTVSYLGNPDHGVIIASYLGSLLMAGGYLAIGSCMSALTKNQIIAFISSISICFIFTVSGFPLVINFFQLWLPQLLLDAISSFSFLSHFEEITKGIINLNDIIYFISVITLWLFINTLVLQATKD
jgi:ABC-2 type transport system permease protein